MQNSIPNKKENFTQYEIFLIAILSIIQFTVILDFMVLSPLGAILMDELQVIPSQFGLVVSAYAFSAGASGLLSAGFADKYDRKKILLFFYSGFVLGTVFCALATTYQFLLIARVITGLFGGVISSIGFAIITDIFKLEVRGRVMGFTQMAFAASQVLGIPIGLFLANRYNWHVPFWMIAMFSAIVCVVIFIYMKPIAEHLKIPSTRSPFQHLWKTLTESDYLKGFLATTLLATGGFMLMPFGSAFATNNLKLSMEDLPLLYGVTGVSSIIFGPIIGRISDKVGKYKVFLVGSIISMVMVAIYTNLGPVALWVVILLNIPLFVGITARMIASSTLLTALPNPQDRGAFMSINSSVQQISGGFASALAGVIVIKGQDGTLLRYDILGAVVIFSIIITIVLFYQLDIHVQKKLNKAESQKVFVGREDVKL